MASLVDALNILEVFGVFRVILPLILIFAIVYGLLSNLKLFGDKSKTVNAIIALVAALLFVSVAQAVQFLNTLLPMVTAMLVIMMLIMMVALFVGYKPESIQAALKHPAGYLIIISIIIIFVFYAFGTLDPNAYYTSHPDEIPEGVEIPGVNVPGTAEDLARMDFMRTMFSPVMVGLIVLILVFAGATYMITREPAS